MTRGYDQEMNRRWIFDDKSLGGIGQIYNGTPRTGCQQKLRWKTYLHAMDFFDSTWTTWTKQCGCSRHGQCWHGRQSNVAAVCWTT